MTFSEHMISRLNTKNHIVGLSAVLILRVNAFCPAFHWAKGQFAFSKLTDTKFHRSVFFPQPD